MTSRGGKIALAWVGVALPLYAVWLLLVDTREVPELLAGVAVAAVAATGSELVRHQRRARVRVRWSWLARLWRAATSVPRDLARLSLAAVKAAAPGAEAPSGRLRALEFDPGRVDGDADPETLGRYALAEIAGSFSPNTFVIGVDGEHRALLVHQLVPERERPRRTIDPLDLG